MPITYALVMLILVMCLLLSNVESKVRVCMNYGTNFISFSFTKTVSYLQTSPLVPNLPPRTMPVCKRRRLPSSSTDALPWSLSAALPPSPSSADTASPTSKRNYMYIYILRSTCITSISHTHKLHDTNTNSFITTVRGLTLWTSHSYSIREGFDFLDEKSIPLPSIVPKRSMRDRSGKI